MKKNFLMLLITIVIGGFSAHAFTQDSLPKSSIHRIPKWISANGYWVLENNIHTPKYNILYFYNNDNVLVYKEITDGVILKLNKRKMKKRLKKLVDQTVISFVKNQKAGENEMLVMNMIRK
ncbi:MAG: hypothetical protein JWP81_581 [Ferruginibacter sp.]|nr:hypothetical protein [Ferruginibacter sp.]